MVVLSCGKLLTLSSETEGVDEGRSREALMLTSETGSVGEEGNRVFVLSSETESVGEEGTREVLVSSLEIESVGEGKN